MELNITHVTTVLLFAKKGNNMKINEEANEYQEVILSLEKDLLGMVSMENKDKAKNMITELINNTGKLATLIAVKSTSDVFVERVKAAAEEGKKAYEAKQEQE
jgi:hypothetical protein